MKTRQRQLGKKVKQISSPLTRFFRIAAQRLRILGLSIRVAANRRTFANILMLCFIIFSSIGAGMIFLPAGWVVAGVCCGIFGFLLGLE